MPTSTGVRGTGTRARWDEAAGAAPAEPIMPKQTKKKAPMERRASAAPVKRRSTLAAAFVGAEARGEPVRAERSPAKKRRRVGASSTDLTDSPASSTATPSPCVEAVEMPKGIGKEE